MLLAATAMRPAALIRATAARLPFRDHSVSVVVSSASLKDWKDREAGVREIARILEPGGRAFLYDFITTGEGSNSPGFRERYGPVTNLLRLMMKFFAPFSLREAQDVAESIEGFSTAVSLQPELGVVRILFQRPPETQALRSA